MTGLFPVLLILFAASGCAALIYELVWFQLLQLVIGSSAVSLGTLLATYMGGMFLGSLAYPKAVPERRHPLRVYALIEAGIGICGIAVLFGMPWLDRMYAVHAGHGLAGILMRALVRLSRRPSKLYTRNTASRYDSKCSRGRNSRTTCPMMGVRPSPPPARISKPRSPAGPRTICTPTSWTCEAARSCAAPVTAILNLRGR